ncbi:hypothetical protein [Corynebacterium glucuronolyticum]|uniref:hypothetical protein n=1 Tax=Corynebacterium glucuronolyticum TaxID=39791 RepID=UPI00223B4C0E|nr:hypothetical protein [Corynebacterium glucuronolyticum]MCT1442440.1 hypothetical protein [Corynebacterium glucuronolyticum]
MSTVAQIVEADVLADPIVVMEQEQGEFTPENSDFVSFDGDRIQSERSADGATAALGSRGAFVGIKVNSSGQYVENAFVNYLDAGQDNSTADQCELFWDDGGGRRSETHGSDSGWGLASSGEILGDISMSARSAAWCWRMWSGYACVQIKP